MTSRPKQTDDLSPLERKRLRRLIDEDDIRKLTVQYSHCLDHGYIEQMRDLFTEDICCQFGPYGDWQGIDAVIKNFKAVFTNLGGMPFASMHTVSNHWINFSHADQASGRRQLMDFLLTKAPDENPLLWLAVYDETYTRDATGWRIASITVELLWPERHASEGFPKQFPA